MIKKNFNRKLDLFFEVLSQSKFGSITVEYKQKILFRYNGQYEGPNSKVIIKNEKCLDDFFIYYHNE